MTEESTDSGDVVRRERFSGGPARGFLSSLAADARLFDADIQVDRAHVVMLAEQEIISAPEAGEILNALAAVEEAGHDRLPGGEDVHAAIETAVVDHIGETGGKMHTARSRNDEVATCLRYRLREDILSLIETVITLRETLRAEAEQHRETTMPGFTHLQPAQPTTVAHYLLSYESALSRDTERLFAAYDRTNRSPLGAAAFAGTPFDIDRTRTAELLGFDEIVENTMDASSARDFLTETTAAVATVATTLSGIAEDLILFANKGYVELADAYASTSSIMPQKKNPDTLELVRASAGDATAGLNGLLTVLKGLPRAYNRDLQRAHGHTFNAIDQTEAATEVAAGAVATAQWDADRLHEEASAGFSTATGVADLLAMSGIPFRAAHEIVAEAAEIAEPGAELEALKMAAENALEGTLTDHVSQDALEQTLDPEGSVASRDSQGGPAAAAVRDALVQVDAGLDESRASLESAEGQIKTASAMLATEVNGYV